MITNDPPEGECGHGGLASMARGGCGLVRLPKLTRLASHNRFPPPLSAHMPSEPTRLIQGVSDYADPLSDPQFLALRPLFFVFRFSFVFIRRRMPSTPRPTRGSGGPPSGRPPPSPYRTAGRTPSTPSGGPPSPGWGKGIKVVLRATMFRGGQASSNETHMKLTG